MEGGQLFEIWCPGRGLPEFFGLINPKHCNISMQILHTILCTFPMVLQEDFV